LRRLCICLFILLFALPASSETFQATRHLPASIPGGSAIQADFNGDGLPDFFYYDPSYRPNGVIRAEILLSHADGSYSDPLAVSLDGTPVGCNSYDVNADRRADLVCVSLASGSPSQQTMYTFIGNGDGTFQSSIRTDISVNNSYMSIGVVAAGDINGDGKLDVILAGPQLFTIYPMLGDGAGHFTLGKSFNLHYYGAVARPLAELHDVNGDGKLDLLYKEPLQVYLGNGDGTFTAGFTGGNYQDCFFADFDKDQHLDAECMEISSISSVILHGNPDGTFNPTPIARPDLSKMTFSLAAKDLNGDGMPDMIGIGGEGTIIYLGKPGLQFELPVAYSFYPVSNSFGLNDPLIGDYNGDGILDLATAGFDGIYIAYGRGDGSLRAPRPTESGTAIGGIAVGDFDQDGVPDVVTSGSPSLQFNHANGDGTFATSTPIQTDGLAANAGTSSLMLQGDFDGDGHLDLITNNSGSLTQIFFGKGNGIFNDPITASSTFNFIPLRGAVVADVNHDGRADLIAPYSTYPTGAVWILLSNGDGSFSAQSIDGFNSPNTPFVGVGDVNGDNKLDLIVSIPGGTQIFLGKGDGTFDQVASAPAAPSMGNTSFNPGQAVFGDFDGDGKKDFAVTAINNLGTYCLTIYYGNGDGSFSAPSTIATGVSSTGLSLNLTAHDLNGDGMDDLVYSGSSVYQSAVISVLHAKPGRTFDAGMGLLAGFGTLTPVVADFNRDGRPDLLFSNSYTSPGVFTVLLNRESTGTTLTVDNTSIQYGQSAGFTAQVTFSADSGSAPPQPSTVVLSGLPGSPVTLPITFSSSGAGAPFIGTARYEAINLLPGTYNVTARLNASCCLTPSKSAIATLVVAPAATTTTLALTPVPPLTGQQATLHVQVSSQTTVASGTITFFDQNTQIGTAPLASGASSFTTSPLSAGAHSITAVFAGDQNFLTSSSQPLALTVFDSGYQLTAAQTNLSLGVNGSTDIVTISPMQGFSGKVNLSCSVTPSDSIAAANLPSCSLSPSIVTLAGAPVSSTLTISDNKSSTTAVSASVLPGGWMGLCLVILVSAIFRRQNRLSWSAFAALLAVHAVTLLSGCAGQAASSSAATNAATKNYTVIVTASSSMPGSAPVPLAITVHRE